MRTAIVLALTGFICLPVIAQGDSPVIAAQNGMEQSSQGPRKIQAELEANDPVIKRYVIKGLRGRVWVNFVMKLPEHLVGCGFHQIDDASQTGMISQWPIYANAAFGASISSVR